MSNNSSQRSHPDSKATSRFHELVSTASSFVEDRLFHLNFYRLHLVYFTVVILLAGTIFWGSNTSGYHVTYTNALFMCASAMTGTGLTVLNLSQINAYQQSILFVLMALGDLTIVTISVVFLRRYFFAKTIKALLQNSETGRRIADDIEHSRHDNTSRTPILDAITKLEKRESDSSNSKPQSIRTETPVGRRNPHHEYGYGGFPWPWEWDVFKGLTTKAIRRERVIRPPRPSDHFYVSFKPDVDTRGRFRNLSKAEEEELGGVEYRALGVLSWLLPSYSFFWLCFSWVFLIPYSTRPSISSILKTSQPGNLNPEWWAFFLGLSAYSNTGLTLLDTSMIPFVRNYYIHIITGTVIIAGNTFYPILLRMTIWLLSLIVSKNSELHHSLAFLLQHPRRCYLLLFPKKNTWYLFGIQIGLFILLWISFGVLNIGYDPVRSTLPDVGERIADALYEAQCVYYFLNMYISAVPFIISLRASNIYEDRSLGEDSRYAGKGGDDTVAGSTVQEHLQNQLAYDLWWIALSVFLISIIERTPLTNSHPGFSLWSILFEVVSAYGTVGLSLGVPYDNFSFCGAWKTLSKLILISVMLRGRHRILPIAIDRAVLLPGQELMKKMDQRFRKGDMTEAEFKQHKDRIRTKEEGQQVEQQDPQHQDLEQEQTDSAKSSAREQENRKEPRV